MRDGIDAYNVTSDHTGFNNVFSSGESAITQAPGLPLPRPVVFLQRDIRHMLISHQIMADTLLLVRFITQAFVPSRGG